MFNMTLWNNWLNAKITNSSVFTWLQKDRTLFQRISRTVPRTNQLAEQSPVAKSYPKRPQNQPDSRTVANTNQLAETSPVSNS
jgi:hypothetical protein